MFSANTHRIILHALYTCRFPQGVPVWSSRHLIPWYGPETPLFTGWSLPANQLKHTCISHPHQVWVRYRHLHSPAADTRHTSCDQWSCCQCGVPQSLRLHGPTTGVGFGDTNCSHHIVWELKTPTGDCSGHQNPECTDTQSGSSTWQPIFTYTQVSPVAGTDSLQHAHR